MNQKKLEALSRTELQTLAKDVGVKANQATAKLISEILKTQPRSKATKPAPAAADDDYVEENEDHPPKPKATTSRARPVSAKPDAASHKAPARSAARGRAESADEHPPTTTTRHVRAPSNATSAPAKRVVSSSSQLPVRKPVAKPAPKPSARSTSNDSDDEIVSKPVARVGPPVAAKRKPVAASSSRAPVRARKPEVPAPPADEAMDEDSADDKKSTAEAVEAKPAPKPRPSITSQQSTPYVELPRRQSTGVMSPLEPLKGMLPPPVPAPKLAQSTASVDASSEPASALATPSASASPPKSSKATPKKTQNLIEEYSVLKTGLTESTTLIQTLKEDLTTARERTARLEAALEAQREEAKAREAELSSRLQSLETAPKSTSADANSALESERITQLETAFASYQRETTGIIDSHKATVSALDQYTRSLEARLKTLELAAKPSAPPTSWEIGTPPPARTGKRDRQENGREEGDETVDESPSMQPNPTKRPRFDEVDQSASPSAFLEESLQHDLQEEQALANLATAGTQQLKSPSKHIDVDSIIAGGSRSPIGAPQDTSTINPAALSKSNALSNNSSPSSRPIAPLRRSSSSSTPAKMIRTSALSFGQALSPSNASVGDFGVPMDSSTPVANRSQADQSMEQGSPDVSFGSAFRPPVPGFSFSSPMVHHAFTTSDSKTGGPATPSNEAPPSPAFPVDANPRASGEYDDIGMASSSKDDSSPPPSPSKRTMYGTEMTTPLRQAFGVDGGRSRPAALSRPQFGGNMVSEGDEDMVLDDTSSVGIDSHSHHPVRDVFGGRNKTPPPSGNGRRSANASPTRYALDDPMSWGRRPPGI